MLGMHADSGFAFTDSSDNYTASWHYELPPTPTVAELSVASYYEFDDEAHVDLGFTHAEYLGRQGQTKHEDYPDIDEFDARHFIVISNMTRADWAMRVSNCSVSYLVNFFFTRTVNRP